MDTSSFDKLINRTIDRRYRIENVVGVGGMAYVLKAKDLVNDKVVAIKMLSDEFKDDERAVKRFINESKTVSMLDHKNIVKILDVVINDERKYIVMEFIDGITLKDYTDKIGALGWKEAIHYTKQVLSALSHAHEKQVIHRDIKPQNIMLLSDGIVKVTDFGIAKMPNAESVTVTDKAIGTVNYISPEQASGSKIDSRTDIYSTGVMLYEMLTGRLPFIADSPVAVAMMQVSNEPSAPREINSQIPVGLEQIVLKAMQKNPDKRFLNAAAMLKALTYFGENPEVVFAGGATDTGAKGAKFNLKEAEKQKAREKKYVRGSRSMFPIISGVAASFFVVAILFVIIWVLPFFKGTMSGNEDLSIDTLGEGISTAVDRFLGVDNADARKVTVPSFVGKTYDDDLIAEMGSLGFAPSSTAYIRNDGSAPNMVVKQDPEANSIRLRPADGKLIPIKLYINISNEEMEMPDCTLSSISDAKRIIRKEANALLAAELPVDAINVIEEFHDTFPAGYVIRTEPVAGEIVTVTEETVFTVYVSKGREVESAEVPNLVGETLESAKRAIVSAKLSLGMVYYEDSSEFESGKVIRASHIAGETVACGITAIDLWVSKGNSAQIPPTIANNSTSSNTATNTEATVNTDASVSGDNQMPSNNSGNTEVDNTSSENPVYGDNGSTGTETTVSENTTTENPVPNSSANTTPTENVGTEVSLGTGASTVISTN